MEPLAAFHVLELRVGHIIRAEPNDKARKPAYKLWIDFGPAVLHNLHLIPVIISTQHFHSRTRLRQSNRHVCGAGPGARG